MRPQGGWIVHGPARFWLWRRVMATISKHRHVRPAIWTTWAPSLGILCLVGAHILAAALGLHFPN